MQHSHTASRWITRTALGVALVVVAQLLGKVIPAGAVIAGPFSVTQLVTGSLVNCVLFVFTATTGIWSGVAIGILSSVLATLIGIGPAIPAVTPVIACGNAVLAVVFGLLRSREWNFARWAAAAVAAAAIKCGAGHTPPPPQEPGMKKAGTRKRPCKMKRPLTVQGPSFISAARHRSCRALF